MPASNPPPRRRWASNQPPFPTPPPIAGPACVWSVLLTSVLQGVQSYMSCRRPPIGALAPPSRPRRPGLAPFAAAQTTAPLWGSWLCVRARALWAVGGWGGGLLAWGWTGKKSGVRAGRVVPGTTGPAGRRAPTAACWGPRQRVRLAHGLGPQASYVWARRRAPRRRRARQAGGGAGAGAPPAQRMRRAAPRALRGVQRPCWAAARPPISRG
jgi:hypothetical protein